MTSEISVSENEFYKLRDNRTNLLTDSRAYQNSKILVIVGPDRVGTIPGQIMALTVANLLSRFSRFVDIAVQDQELDPSLQHPNFADVLHLRLLEEMTAADPYGSFSSRDYDEIRETNGGDYDYSIVIGKASSPPEPYVSIDGRGWCAGVAKGEFPDEVVGESRNPIGPASAACLGAAEIFKALTGAPKHQRPSKYSFDAYTLTPSLNRSLKENRPDLPPEIEAGSIELVGVGAIGSAFLYFLQFVSITGSLTLIDPDWVEYSNLNRSPVFSAQDACKPNTAPEKRTPKVEAGHAYIEDHLPTEAFAEKYGESVDQNRLYPDIVLAEVDDERARESIQFSRPPLMFETLTDGSAVDLRRHQPICEPCILCHLPPGDAPYDPTCATIPTESIETDSVGDDPDAALPFVSYLSGILLLGELIKTQYESYPVTENYVSVELYSDFSIQDRHTVDFQSDCVYCNYTDPDFHREQIHDSRFLWEC